MSIGWRVGADVGGTFADCVAAAADGRHRRIKLLTDGRLRVPCVPAEEPGMDLLLEGIPPWTACALAGSRYQTAHGEQGLIALAEAVDRGVFVQLRADPRTAADATVATDADQAATTLPDAEVQAARAPRWLDCSSGEEAPIFGARLLTETPLGQPLPLMQLRIGTTRGTNALLEGALDPVAAFVNEGLEGLLSIGTQQRLGLFDLVPRVPPALATRCVGVRGRLAADGSEVVPLDEERLRADARVMRGHGVSHAAVAFIHAWRHRGHEDRAAQILTEEGFERVVLSADMSPAPRLLPRAQTAAVDAALSSAVLGMLGRITTQLGHSNCALSAGTSAGGMTLASCFSPKDSLLSGPAMGCAAAANAMRAAGLQAGITFDMGGTSTDVARIGPEGVALVGGSQVAGISVATPSVDVHSVAAGGGSVCRATKQGLFVGPQSAGSAPGPACYGGGGPLTLTDVNLLLGRLVPRAGGLPLDREAALRAADREAREGGIPRQEMLAGFLALANEHMASAVRAVCAAGGHDPGEHTLLVYGGAGGQHACAVAQALGVRRAIVLAHAGFVSATGALDAQHACAASATVRAALGDGGALAAGIEHARAQAMQALTAQALTGQPLRATASMHLPDHAGAIEVELGVAAACGVLDAGAIRSAFAERFRAIFGRVPGAADALVDEVRVVVAAVQDEPGESAAEGLEPGARSVHALGGAAQESEGPSLAIDALDHGTLAGPAVVSEAGATIVVDVGWSVRTLPSGALLLERGGEQHSSRSVAEAPTSGLVALELAAARFSAIASWMGVLLERSARSVNVKDRLDFSCGLMDAQGRLCANAPHVPVHLGALGACVRSINDHRVFVGDEVVLTNHPAFGGSHLPDLTVARAVDDDDGQRLGFVAARAHHAEIGGSRPGSMPPDAHSLIEEGVVIPPTVIARSGVLDEAATRALLAAGPWPSRDPDANVDDLRAAIAAVDAGAAALQALARSLGGAAVRAAMQRLLERSVERTRALLARIPAEGLHAREALDDGAPIVLSITRLEERMRIDFTGSAPVHPGAFNAPAAVVRSAVLYVLRLLAGLEADLDEHRAPLNEGFLEPVDLVLPEGMLNPRFDPDPARSPAVFAGNTETSQRVVDALLSAFGVVAASQGTMNNLVIGGAGFSSYETIGGGAGASRASDGTNAVHVHMTNTRLTDPETLELRLPLRLECLQVRAHSGGAGLHRGGDGMIRRLRALEPAELCFVGQRRGSGPTGLDGGAAGARGEQCLIRADGVLEPLGATATALLLPGDAVEVRTPGGGGCGVPLQ